MRILKMHPLPLQSWTWILVILYVLPIQEIFIAAELDHGMTVQRNQRDTSGRYNPHAGQHQHTHHDGKEHHHEGEDHHHEGEEHRHDGEEHHHVEEAQEQNTVENFAPPEKSGYEYGGEKGVIEAPDTKFDYDDKTVAPVCGCVLKNQCGGAKEDEDTINILRATPTTLVCGLKYQMCCKYDYYENGQPWPGVVDLYLDKAPCVAEEICRRPYGVQPTDVRDFGTIPHCPGFGSVRCLDGFAIKDDASLFIPNEQPTHIEVPIFPTVETNDLSGSGVIAEVPVVQTVDTPVSFIPEPEIPKTSYGVPTIPYTYLPPTPPPVTPPPATPPPVTNPPETPPPVTTPPATPPPVTDPPETPPPVTTPPETPPPATGYTYPTITPAPPLPVTEPPYVYLPPPPVTEPPYVYLPPPPVTEPPYVYLPPPPVTEPPQVYLPPPPVTEPPQVYLPPVTEPPQGYLPPVAVPPSSYRAPAVDVDRELLIEEKPVVPVVTSSRYYSPPLRGFYKSRPKYFTIPKIGYYGAPYYKNFYNYNPYYKGFNFGGFNFQKRISFSKSIYG